MSLHPLLFHQTSNPNFQCLGARDCDPKQGSLCSLDLKLWDSKRKTRGGTGQGPGESRDWRGMGCAVCRGLFDSVLDIYPLHAWIAPSVPKTSPDTSSWPGDGGGQVVLGQNAPPFLQSLGLSRGGQHRVGQMLLAPWNFPEPVIKA